MPQVAIALAGAFATSFGVASLGITATSVFGLSAGMSFVIRAGLGLASYALSQSSSQSSGGKKGYKVTASGSALDHQVIYGEAKVAGVRVYDATYNDANNTFLQRFIAFAGHEIDSYVDIYINDTKVNALDANGFVTSIIDETGAVNTSRYGGANASGEPSVIRIKKAFGTPGQAYFTTEDPIWTTAHKLSNIAYLYVRFEQNNRSFPNGVPEITAVIRGKKVYDPRTAATVWSDNPCLCIRDYLTEAYGVSALTSEVDDTRIIAGANICDQVVALEKRFTLNGAFTTGAQPVDILSSMLTSMAGTLWYSQGKWKVKPAYYTASVMTLDEDDLRSNFTVSTRHSRRDNFNTVKGTWQGSATNWQATDYTKVTDAAYVSVDGGQESAIDLNLPFTTSHLTAQRIAQITLRGNREQLTVSANFGLRSFELEVGDVVNITNSRMGWVAKNFEVMEWNFSLTSDMTLEVSMSLKETSSAVYTSVSGVVFERNNTILPSPFVTGVVTGLAAVGSSVLAGDGSYVGTIDVNWLAPSNQNISGFIFEYKLSTDVNYFSRRVFNNSYRITPVSDNSTYNIRVRAVNSIGIQGPTTSVNFVTDQDTTAPPVIAFGSATGVYKAVELRWNLPTVKDFKEVLIYVNSTNSSVGSSLIAKLSTTYYSHNLQPNNTTNFYFIRASDRTGNLSDYSVGISATTLPGIPTVDLSGVLDIAQFAASIRPVEVLGVLPATGNFTGRMVFLTTDHKLYRHTGSPVGADGFTLAVDGNDITANSIVAGKIAAGAISTTELAAGAATITKLSIADFTNQCENPSFELAGPVGWSLATNFSIGSIAARTGTNCLLCTYSGVALTSSQTNRFQFDTAAGDQWRAYVWTRNASAYAGGQARVGIQWLDSAGAQVSISFQGITTTTSYQRVLLQAVAPALAVKGRVILQVQLQTEGQVLFDDVHCTRMNAGELIVDGVVSANHMAANSITAGNAAIANATVNTLQIAGQAVTVAQNATSSVDVLLAVTPADLVTLTFTRTTGFQTFVSVSVDFLDGAASHDAAAPPSHVKCRVFRDAVELQVFSFRLVPMGSGANAIGLAPITFSFIDPDTTGGSVTYKFKAGLSAFELFWTVRTDTQTIQCQQFKR